MSTTTETVNKIPTITENEQKMQRIKDAVEHGSLLSNEDACFVLARLAVAELQRNRLYNSLRRDNV